jgi:hypothetical protein
MKEIRNIEATCWREFFHSLFNFLTALLAFIVVAVILALVVLLAVAAASGDGGDVQCNDCNCNGS